MMTLAMFAAFAWLIWITLQTLGPHVRLVTTRLRSGWGVAIVAFAVAAGALALQHAAEVQQVTLTVDMLVDRGGAVEVYLNDPSLPPLRAAVTPNVRTKYRFSGIPLHVKMFRLDPTDAADATINIYGITFESRGQTVLQIPPAAIASWQQANIAQNRLIPGALSMKASNDDPILASDLNLSIDVMPRSLAALGEALARPYNLILFGLFLLFLIAGCSSWWGLRRCAVLAAWHIVGYGMVAVLMRIGGPAPSVHSAVGHASLIGYPKFHDYLAAFALLGLAAVICLGAVRLGFLQDFAVPADSPVTGRQDRRYSQWAVNTVVILFIVLLYQPDLTATLDSLRHFHVTRASNWDFGILGFWSYLVHNGRLPYRDFWYPYGGFYLQAKPLPFGEIALWIHQVICLSLLYLGLFYVLGRKLAATLAGFLVLLIPAYFGMLSGWPRYILAIDFILAYLALHTIKPASSRYRWLLAPVAGYVFFMEPVQLMYGVAGLILYSLLEFVLRSGGVHGRLLARKSILNFFGPLATDYLPVMLGVCAVLAWFAFTGQLGGFLEFNASANRMYEYSAVPSDIAAWMGPRLTAQSVFVIIFYLLTIAFFEWIRSRGKVDDSLTALLVLGGTAFACLQKQVMRPHMAEQLIIYPAVGTVLYVAWMWHRRTLIQNVLVGCFVGLVLAMGIHNNFDRIAYTSLREGFSRTARNAQLLFTRTPEIGEVNAAQYSSGHIDIPEMHAVVSVLQSDYGLKTGEAIYVLGDDPFFYILMGEDGPYVTNNYNSSPLHDQQRIVTWLQRTSPRFVIWNASDKQFDAVQNVVRVPVIYNYVIRTFTFARTIGPYTILRSRGAQEPVDLAFWAARLGPSIQLGHIPGMASPPPSEECAANKTGCGDYLLMRVPRQYMGLGISVQVRSKAGDFILSFETDRSASEYVVPLERIWFWPILSKVDPDPSFVRPPGTQLNLVHRRTNEDVLY
jgi:hypothetical protein